MSSPGLKQMPGNAEPDFFGHRGGFSSPRKTRNPSQAQRTVNGSPRRVRKKSRNRGDKRGELVKKVLKRRLRDPPEAEDVFEPPKKKRRRGDIIKGASKDEPRPPRHKKQSNHRSSKEEDYPKKRRRRNDPSPPPPKEKKTSLFKRKRKRDSTEKGPPLILKPPPNNKKITPPRKKPRKTSPGTDTRMAEGLRAYSKLSKGRADDIVTPNWKKCPLLDVDEWTDDTVEDLSDKTFLVMNFQEEMRQKLYFSELNSKKKKKSSAPFVPRPAGTNGVFLDRSTSDMEIVLPEGLGRYPTFNYEIPTDARKWRNPSQLIRVLSYGTGVSNYTPKAAVLTNEKKPKLVLLPAKVEKKPKPRDIRVSQARISPELGDQPEEYDFDKLFADAVS